MFGHDSKGDEVVEPEDGTIKATALADAMHEHLFADAFVNTVLRDVPVVRSFVDAQQQGPTAKCFTEQGVCCDLSRLQCGPSQSAVEKARSTPLPTGPPAR